MRENFRFAFTVLALVGLVIPGVVTAYDYGSDESDVVLHITDEIDLTVNAEVRTRFEWNENLVDFSNDLDDEFGYVPSRVRLGFGLTLPRDVDLYIEAQETFSFGEDTPARLTEGGRQMPNMPINGGIGNIATAGLDGDSSAARSNENARASGNFITSTHRDDLGLYQAYVTANNIGDTNFSVRVGRQEWAFGNELLLGDNDFYGGASLDGIRGWWDFDRSQLNVFWSKLDESNTGSSDVNSTDDDTDLFGAYFIYPEVGSSLIGFDAYGMGVKSNADGGAASHSTNLASYWVGGRVYRAPEWGFHFNAEAVYQFGEITTGPTSDVDIQAFAFEGSAGYTFDVVGNPDIHGGLTWGSGDNDPTDGDMETFFSITPDNHGRLGFADLFNMSNIMAYQLGYAGSWENLAWGVELYQFEMDEEMASGADEYGNEVDLWFSYQYSRNLSVQIAYAFVSIEDAIEEQVNAAGFSADDSQRFYVNVRLLM